MTSFKVSAGAKEDLKNIATYTQKRWGRAQRDIYLKQFDDTFHTLAESPELGTNCDFIKSGYRAGFVAVAENQPRTRDRYAIWELPRSSDSHRFRLRT